MVIALAGRRIDAPNAAQRRFPEEHTDRVIKDIGSFFEESKTDVLVCAAACGTDILALEMAGELGIRRRIVLPYDVASFRESSVIDRPGDWGVRYDRIVADVAGKGDLIAFNHERDKNETYYQTNLDILDQAAALAAESGQDLGALVVWNGVSRGEDDVTGHFREQALSRGLKVTEILTI